MSKPIFVIIDGNAIVHRAYHAIPPLTTKDGQLVNAVYGFVSMLLKTLTDLRPQYIAVTFDLAAPTFRHKQYEKYKATRVKADQELYDQIPVVKEVVRAFNFPIYAKEGYEADDVIGTIVEYLKADGVDTYIVTGDMDTLQLASDKVKIYTLRKGLSDVVVYDPEAVKERFGFEPEKMVEYKAIRGDTSDNIPGVPGIGEKGAAELVIKMGTLQNVYAHLDELKNFGFKDGLINRLKEGKDSAFMSRELSLIDCHVPDLKFKIEDCKIKPYEREKLVSLFQKLEFVSLLKRIPEFGPPEQKEKKARAVKSKLDFVFKEIKSSEIKEVQKKILDQKKFTARVLLQGEDLFAGEVSGLVLVVQGETFFVAPELVPDLLPIFQNSELTLVGHDLKQLLKVFLIKYDVEPACRLFDVMIASYLINPGSRAHDVPSLVLKVLGKELTAGSDQKSLFGIDKRMIAYETFLVSEIEGELKTELDELDNLGLLEKIEMPLVPALAQMELNGVAVDLQVLQELSERLKEQVGAITKKIYVEAGEEFNISSPIQLREILFEKMKIPVEGIKKGKTGLSTSAEELEKLKGLHPIIDDISAYRELTKLQNTYVDTLPALINPKTRRIHSSFNQAIAATGRLSSSDPNLQNIPVRTDLGREIRSAFVAENGNMLVSADYSQIELRVVASLAEDQKMIEIFNQDEDIHRATAAAINGVPLDKVTKSMRYAAKEINFGVLYGMGVYGLSWRADISREEAKKFIDKYFEEFSGVKKYLDGTLKFTREEGYAETLFGRRRYLPELLSSNYQLRSAAERMAVNHPIQGTAADIIKMAMIDIHGYLRKKFPKGEAKMILQVHDELVFEVRQSLVEELKTIIKDMMEKVVQLRVPVKVQVASGHSWGEMK